jgi:hypothetical protein
MAQNATASSRGETPEGDTSAVSAVPLAMAAATPEPSFSGVAGSSTAATAPSAAPTAPDPAPAKENSESSAPGESKWIILAAIVTTAAVVAAILLFPHFRGHKPVGTVITAGTPTIGTPNH